jgi:hypothetical protein
VHPPIACNVINAQRQPAVWLSWQLPVFRLPPAHLQFVHLGTEQKKAFLTSVEIRQLLERWICDICMRSGVAATVILSYPSYQHLVKLFVTQT